jgi:mRNA-degrading endonuclease toxin of MazEF toxin-antitoxin module
MNPQFGEVVLIRMQFHQTPGAKVRPALVLLDTGDNDFVAAPITSQLRNSGYDFAIKDWRSAGLNIASYVRVHKLTVLAKADILRSLALLSARDRDSLRALLCRAFCETGPAASQKPGAEATVS